MDQVLYVLAIMGCSDDFTECHHARVEPVRYTSIQACQEAMASALRRNADIDYPVISATCRRETPQLVEAQRAIRGG